MRAVGAFDEDEMSLQGQFLQMIFDFFDRGEGQDVRGVEIRRRLLKFTSDKPNLVEIA